MIMLRDDKQAAKDRNSVPWLLLSVFPAALFVWVVMYG